MEFTLTFPYFLCRILMNVFIWSRVSAALYCFGLAEVFLFWLRSLSASIYHAGSVPVHPTVACRACRSLVQSCSSDPSSELSFRNFWRVLRGKFEMLNEVKMSTCMYTNPVMDYIWRYYSASEQSIFRVVV